MSGDSVVQGKLREQWETNVTPLVTAVREGASHANQVGRREWRRSHRWAQMRRRTKRWRQPWVAVAAALAIIGVVGGVRAARARRSAMDPDLAAVRDEARAGVRARMEAGRERVAAVAARRATTPRGTATHRGTATPPEPGHGSAAQ